MKIIIIKYILILGLVLLIGTSIVKAASIFQVWQGGTGVSSVVSGDILYADGTDSLAALNKGADSKVLKLVSGIPSWETDATGAGGSAIVFDIDDDGGDDSTDVTEIATSGDTNSIFSEPSADKILITLSNDWPKADTADDLTCTDCINATEIEDIYILKAGYSTGALTSDLNVDSDTFVISYDDNNVGIGTNAPVGRIHVVGNDATKKGALGFAATDKQNSSSIYVQGDGFGYFIAADTTNDIEFVSGVSSLGEGMVNTATLHALDIRTNNVSRIHIQADGDVGIGTKTPTYNFELATGKSFGIGTTQWNSADEINGTKIKDADYGDVVIDAAGDWQISEGEVDHDSLLNFVANEHLDWTSDLGATNIHTGNYTDTNTTYTAGTGLTLTTGAFSVNTSQNIATLSNLTTNGFITTSGGIGTLGIDTNTYLTGNQTITLSGDVTGSGETALTVTVANDKILESHLKSVNAATDEYCLTYEATTGDFEWQECAGGAGDITDVFDCTTGDCNTMTVGTSEYLTYGTGYIDANRFLGVTTVDSTEFGYLDGVSSAIQTQFGGKQSTLTNSAGLLAALNDETGTGLSVFSTSPTFTTPLLGTPTSGVLTNCTGLPEAGLVDNAVTLAKMAHGTDGNLITYDADGAPAAVVTGDADQVLTSNGVGTAPTFQDAAGGAGDVGGLYGINVETLAADKTLTVDSNKIYQYLDEGGANRIITLATAGASAGDRFVIRHNGYYVDNHYLQIKQSATELDKIYAGGIKKFIFDGTNWVSGGNGVGENDEKKRNLAIGQLSRSDNNGTALGSIANADNNGVAIGYYTFSSTYGVAVGITADGANYGTSLGGNTDTNSKKYSVALGYYSETERYSEIAHCIDGSYSQDYNFSIAGWAIQTANATPVEMFLGEEANQRFTINPESVVSFTIRIAARDNVSNEVASYKIEGLVKRDGAGNTVLSWSNKTVQYEDDASWDVAVTADDTNEALIITVTGDGTNPVRFAGRIDEVETQF